MITAPAYTAERPVELSNDPAYSRFLDEYSIAYVEEKFWLSVGASNFDNCWVLFLSVRPADMPNVLERVLPILAGLSVSFKIIKNQKYHFSLNEGLILNNAENMGSAIVLDFAKAITIYPTDLDQTKLIVSKLLPLTIHFKAPEIPDATRIGSILYTSFCATSINPETGEPCIIMTCPVASKMPFPVQKGIQKFKLKRRIYNGRFIPISALRIDTKGIIWKAIDVKNFRFTWVLLKIGKAYAFEDRFNRDVRDRLLWEREGLSDLKTAIRVPAPLAFFEYRDFSGLALEWIEGQRLTDWIKKTKSDAAWHALDYTTKLKMLGIYGKVTAICQIIHDRDCVHRDITCNNFLVEPDLNICLLDFELCYSLVKSLPAPPYMLGTFGYISPQQREGITPTFSDDIYSLGAVLLYFLTGVAPVEAMKQHGATLAAWLFEHTHSDVLSTLVCSCLHEFPENRPASCMDIELLIKRYLQEIKP